MTAYTDQVQERIDRLERMEPVFNDLLAALEAAWKWTEHDSEQRAIAAELGVGEWEAFMPPWAEQVRAAIAKAREVKP